MANATGSGDHNLQLHKRVLQSTPAPLSIGLEKPSRFREENGLNEHPGQHENGTVQSRTDRNSAARLTSRQMCSLFRWHDLTQATPVVMTRAVFSDESS